MGFIEIWLWAVFISLALVGLGAIVVVFFWADKVLEVLSKVANQPPHQMD